MTPPPDDPAGSPHLSSPLLLTHLTMLATKAAFHLGTDRACSITAADGAGVRRVASSDARAAHCDEVDVASGDGPALGALRDLRVVLVPDLRADRGWGSWGRAARGVGFRSALAYPCHLDGTATATLTVYATTTGPWDHDALALCDAYAHLVAAMVDMGARIGDADARRVALQGALVAEAAVQRAVGAIMATRGCDRAEAMHVLRTGARREDLPVAGAARAVLDGLLG